MACGASVNAAKFYTKGARAVSVFLADSWLIFCPRGQSGFFFKSFFLKKIPATLFFFLKLVLKRFPATFFWLIPWLIFFFENLATSWFFSVHPFFFPSCAFLPSFSFPFSVTLSCSFPFSVPFYFYSLSFFFVFVRSNFKSAPRPSKRADDMCSRDPYPRPPPKRWR